MASRPIPAFLDAAKTGDVAALAAMVSAGMPVDAWVHRDQLTALHVAILFRQHKAMTWLLQHGANHNHRARGSGLAWHVLLTAQSSSGHTALDRLMWQELLARGVQVNAPGSFARTALLQLARYHRHTSFQLGMVEDLLAVPGIHIEAKEDGTQQTALAIAVEARHPAMVKVLLRAGADPWNGDAWGRHAISRAEAQPDKHILGLLMTQPLRQQLAVAVEEGVAASPTRTRPRL